MVRMRLLLVWIVVVCSSTSPVAAATVSQWVSAVEAAATAEGVLTPPEMREPRGEPTIRSRHLFREQPGSAHSSVGGSSKSRICSATTNGSW